MVEAVVSSQRMDELIDVKEVRSIVFTSSSNLQHLTRDRGSTREFSVCCQSQLRMNSSRVVLSTSHGNVYGKTRSDL